MKRPGRILKVALASVGKKPATIKYPAEKIDLPEKFRGQIKFDAGLCIGCKACMRDCPSDAIVINKIAAGVFEAVFELDRCLYCAQCVDSCPKDALIISPEFELAQLDRKKLKVTFHASEEVIAKAAAAAAAKAEKAAAKVKSEESPQ